MNKFLNKILFPGTNIKDYATITSNESLQEKVYLKNGTQFIDISTSHWLLCLEPMLFGIWVTKNEAALFKKDSLSKIYFADKPVDTTFIEKKSLSILTVDFYNKIEDENGTLLLLKLQTTSIKHLSAVKTWLLFLLHYKKKEIPFKKFKSLVAAFTYPRKVCLVSVQKDDYYNIFPMDLLGEIKNNKYVFGLRHSNNALSKILETGKIVVADVSHNYKNIIYELGKHHGTNPPVINLLPFNVIRSNSFNFPVPEFADTYKEIKITQSINLGSQMLLWGEIVNEVSLQQSNGHLYHIHFLYYLNQQNKMVNIHKSNIISPGNVVKEDKYQGSLNIANHR